MSHTSAMSISCKPKIYCSLFIFIFFIITAGCADTKYIKQELKVINKRLKMLNVGDTAGNVSLVDIYKELEEIKKKLKLLEQINVVKRNQANIQVVIDEQTDHVQQVKGGLENMNRLLSSADKMLKLIEEKLNQIAQRKAEIDDLNKNIQLINTKVSQLQEINEISLEEETKKNEYRFDEVNLRVAGVEKKVSGLFDILKSKALKTTGKKDKKAKSSESGSVFLPSSKRTRDELNSSNNYQTAYNYYLNGNYDKAIDMFTKYLNTNSETRLSDNAQYWLGECYYSKKEYKTAAVEFNKVIKNFPKSNKVPSALLKSVYTLDIINKPQDALAALTVLIEKFPKSEEAELAKKKMADLKDKLTVGE